MYSYGGNDIINEIFMSLNSLLTKNFTSLSYDSKISILNV